MVKDNKPRCQHGLAWAVSSFPNYINLGHPAVSRRVKGKRFQIVMFFNPMSGWLSYTPICMWRDLFGRLREIGPKCWQHALTVSLHTIPPQREKWMLVFDMIHCLPFSLKTWWHKYWSWHRCTRFTQWAWGVYSLQVSDCKSLSFLKTV